MAENMQSVEYVQVIGFTIGGEQFAIDISNVHEINRFEEIKKIPELSTHILGIIDLRGIVIPVISLADIIGLQSGEISKDTRIIICEIQSNKVGILVDSVSEVINIPVTDINPPPPVIKSCNVEYIKGLFKNNNEFVLLLDTNKLSRILLPEELIASCEQLNTDNLADNSMDNNAIPQKFNEDLEKIVKITKAMSEGDFHQNIEDNLYGQLGEVAKYINRALKKLQNVEPDIECASNNIPKASMQLSEITKFSEEATHKIMAQIEKVLENHNIVAERIKDITDSEIIDEIKDIIMKNKEMLMDVFTNLSFQDLMGQKIKKIIEIIQEVEKQILEIIITFGLKDKESPERIKEIAENPDLNQDIVDNLLKEFGFD